MIKNNLKKRLKSQSDILKVTSLATGSFASVFKVEQRQSQSRQTQIVRCLSKVTKPYILRRETELLEYLNQYPEFVHLNETRKIAKHSVQFFDHHGDFSLRRYVAKFGPLNGSDSLKLLSNILTSLEKLHAIKMVHTDIKPPNIIVGQERFYLIDFTQTTFSKPTYETEQMVGDDRYCPPERMNGQYDIKSDLYSLGQTLFFALTGQHIFELTGGESEWEKLYANAFFNPQNLHLLSNDWQMLILWMTQKAPEKRPSLEELKQWLNDKTVPEWLQTLDLENQLNQAYQNRFATNCLQALCDAGYDYANFCYANQIKKAQPEKAYDLFKQGARNHYSRSTNNLALMYEEGVFVKQSWEKARKLYAQALKKQNPFAAYNLGLIYKTGLDTPKNGKLAFKLFSFAASRGNASAQVALAEAYLKGDTPRKVKKPKKRAKFWLKLAANQGNQSAIKRLTSLKKTKSAKG